MNVNELQPGALVTWRRDVGDFPAEVVAVKRSSVTFHTRPSGERFKVRVPGRVKVRCTIDGTKVERWVADYNLEPLGSA